METAANFEQQNWVLNYSIYLNNEHLFKSILEFKKRRQSLTDDLLSSYLNKQDDLEDDSRHSKLLEAIGGMETKRR